MISKESIRNDEILHDQHASGCKTKHKKSFSVYVKVPKLCPPTDMHPRNLIKIKYFIKVNGFSSGIFIKSFYSNNSFKFYKNLLFIF